MATIKEGLNAVGRENGSLERSIALHQQRLKKAIGDLERRILFLFSEKLVREGGRLVNTKVKLKQAQQLHKRLTILFEQEFGKAVVSVVKDFDKIAEAIETRFVVFNEAYAFSNVTAETITALKTAVMREFDALGIVARERVASSLYGAVLVGGQFNLLERDIRSVLTGRYSKVGRPMTSYAGQMAFDQGMYFHNTLNTAEADRAGLDHFLYYGNTQSNTRPFCRQRAGKVYSRKQIESWTHSWVGKAGPAMQYRGGYNCRHTLLPVPDSWYKGKEEEIKAQHKEVQKKKRRRKRREKK